MESQKLMISQPIFLKKEDSRLKINQERQTNQTISPSLLKELQILFPSSFCSETDTSKKEASDQEETIIDRKQRAAMLIKKKAVKPQTTERRNVHLVVNNIYKIEVTSQKQQKSDKTDKMDEQVREQFPTRRGQQRQRTRQTKIQNQVIKPIPHKLTSGIFQQALKFTQTMSFHPMHNYYDGRYSIIDRRYALNCGMGEFTIVNDKACPIQRRTNFKFIIEDSSCAVGITINKKDAIKYAKSKRHYLMYHIKQNKLNVCGSSTYTCKVFENAGNMLMCVVDLINMKFVVMCPKGIIRSQNIPEQFNSSEIHFCIELKDKGKIKFI